MGAVRVIVIGGGAIGLGAGYKLQRRGAEVAVLERDRIGAGASLGNTGWVTPALGSIPIPGPGVIPQALRWMLHADSPFLIRPRPDPAFARWLWAFRAACARPRADAAMAALAAHNAGVLEALDRWRAQHVEFELHREGLIHAALSEAVATAEYDAYRRLRTHGFDVEVELLDGDQLRRREPALSPRVVAGLVSPGEWHVRPETLTAGLRAALERGGAEVREGFPVARLERRDGRWRAIGAAGEIEADRVVLAAGAWTGALARAVGWRLPLEPAKGYSVTAAGEGERPRHAVSMLEARVACSPFDGAVRLAGTLELRGHDLTLNRTRLGAVARAADSYLRWRPVDPELEWAGLRPLLPDCLPAIGAVPGRDGLFVSTGHGMSGITQAAASACALAPVVLGEPPPAELAALSPARFRR